MSISPWLLSGGLIFFYFIIIIYVVICCARIARKAGYSPWFGVLMIIPLINLIIVGIFAYETWPIQKPRVERMAEQRQKLQRQLEALENQEKE